MGRIGVVETASSSSQPQKTESHGEASKLALGSTALSLASLMLLTDSAEAQQSSGPLPTIQVNPPQRAKQKQGRPQRVARPAPAPAATAPGEPTQSQATGPGTGYQAAQPGVSRIATPLIDTPQTINVVTQQEIRDRNITSMEDALRGIPGITFNAGEGGQQGDAPIIRGFVSRGDIFRDGIRDPGWYTRDLFSVERVEVYKGPSAFAFGRGSTGGAINLVSKLPTGQTFLETLLTRRDADRRPHRSSMRAARSGTSRRASPPWDRISTRRRAITSTQALRRCPIILGGRDRQDQSDRGLHLSRRG